MSAHTHFIAAIAKKPSEAVTAGIRSGGGQDPNPELFARQHDTYVRTLEDCGLAVTVLPADPQFPDSVFVEDTALCFKGFAVMLRPGAPSRAGELAAISSAISQWYDDVEVLERGHVDGGDVLWTGPEVIVGQSARTNLEGATALVELLTRRGLIARIAQTPAGVLHFKSDSSSLDSETILATTRVAQSGVFDSYRVMEVPPGEEAAANAVRIRDHVFIPAGSPATAALLSDAGFNVVELDNSEPALIDGGLSCMSLRIPEQD